MGTDGNATPTGHDVASAGSSPKGIVLASIAKLGDILVQTGRHLANPGLNTCIIKSEQERD
jgi:hypothetical protein